MKKIITLVIVIIVALLIFICFYPIVQEKSVDLSPDRESFQVLDLEGQSLLNFSIEDWQDWAEANWNNSLSEPLMIGQEEITPDRFLAFDAVVLSPNFEEVAFSLSSYAMLTDLSLVNIIDLNSGQIRMSSKGTFGQIGEIQWDPSGRYLAYSLNTARAGGDALAVDETDRLTKKFRLGESEIVAGLQIEDQIDSGVLNPEFRNLSWAETGSRLHFTTNTLNIGQNAFWSIDPNGIDLVLEEITPVESWFEKTGVLIINNPGIPADSWHLSYEEAGAPGLLIEIQIDEETECLGNSDYCQRLIDRDEALAGQSVNLKGIIEGEYLKVTEIGF
jgi:hypothetical protein